MRSKWQQLWLDLSHDPSAYAGFVLMALNGLSLVQLQALQAEQVNLAAGWLYTAEGAYPLVSQSTIALAALAPTTVRLFENTDLTQLLERYHITEAELKRRLAGAIWITSDEGRLIQDYSGAVETPILPLRFAFPFSVVEQLSLYPDSDIAQQSRAVLQHAADWLVKETLASPAPLTIRRLTSTLLEGRTVFLIASTGVNGLNFLHNLIMGRLLSPAGYSQLSLLITLQLLLGLIPSTLQTVSARFSATYIAQSQLGFILTLRRTGNRFTYLLGASLMVLLLGLSHVLTNVFQLDSAWLVLPIAIATPLFISMGTDRGVLQGLNAFYWLAAAYVMEAAMRLGVGSLLGYALREAGHSLDGAVWGVAQGMVMTWFISWLALRHFQVEHTTVPPEEQHEWRTLTSLILMALIGQAIITNSDFLLVKTFFSSNDSGLYAAVSVLGRIAYFGTLPLTVVMVPLIAKQQALGESTQKSLWILLGGGIVLCGTLLLVASLFAPLLLKLLYGNAYESASTLLPLYTLSASLYVLTNLVVTYRIALGQGSETWLPLLGGILQVVGILLLHKTLQQVIWVQVILMAVLLVAVLARVLRTTQSAPRIV